MSGTQKRLDDFSRFKVGMRVRIVHNETTKTLIGDRHYNELVGRFLPLGSKTFPLRGGFANQFLFRERGEGVLEVMNSIVVNGYNMPINMVVPVRYSNPLKKETNIR